jgi:hypothetical protein
MILRGGEFSTDEMGNFHPQLTARPNSSFRNGVYALEFTNVLIANLLRAREDSGCSRRYAFRRSQLVERTLKRWISNR